MSHGAATGLLFCEATDWPGVGKKAENLRQLSLQGFNVPDFFVIAPECLRPWFQQLDFSGVTPPHSDAVDSVADWQAFAESIQRVILASEFTADIADAVLAAHDQMFAGQSVAVRSSGLDEDGDGQSFAGQHDSFLWVGRDRLLTQVKACVASFFNAHALFYRRQRAAKAGLASTCTEAVPDNLGAVIVQQMVDADKSGVAFSVDPVSQNIGVSLVSAAYGLGEGVVADLADVDSFWVDRQRLVCERQNVIAKTRRVIFDAEQNGCEVQAVPQTWQEVAVLSEQQLAEVVTLAGASEKAFGKPQDIEWSMDATGELYLLQSRAITTLQSGQPVIFDNTNISENYPGVSLPLTYSFSRHLYASVSRAICRRFGVSEKAVQRHRYWFENFIGYLNHQIYYNLSYWYRIYSIIPGLDRNIPVWEKTLGLDNNKELRASSDSLLEGWQNTLLQTRTLICVSWQYWRMESHTRSFHRQLSRVKAHIQSLDLAALNAQELLDLFDESYYQVIDKGYGEVTLINDFFTFIYFDLLDLLTVRWGISEESLRNELLAQYQDMESVKPIRSMQQLCQLLGQFPALRQRIVDGEAVASLWQGIQSNDDYAAFYQALQQHIQLFGDRVSQELKLEVKTLTEQPERLLGHIRQFLASASQLQTAGASSADKRQRIEERLEAALREKPWKKVLYRWVLSRSKQGIARRENLRFDRTRFFGVARRIFQAVGEVLQRDGVLAQADDIYYLSIEEISGFIRGSGVQQDLSALVVIRKTEVEADRGVRLDQRLVTWGAVQSNTFTEAVTLEESAGSNEPGVFQGIGCSQGTVIARARVVENPNEVDDISGCILVADSTDPGWVYLMASAKGLIVERGNVLSHTAIIGREMAVPTVVGAKGVLTGIRDGDWLQMDGKTGVVRLVTPPDEHPASVCDAENKALQA